jgi:lipoyl(octanoyl) transferase
MKKPSVFIHDIGLIDYQEGWDYQEKLFKKAIDHKIAKRKGEFSGVIANHLLFCQHPHVYTLGKSGKKRPFIIERSRACPKKRGILQNK